MIETARALLALSGDKGNTVPKYGITPGEVMVLQKLHGEDAVFDIMVMGEADRTTKAERVRLIEEYPAKQAAPPPATVIFPSVVAADMPTQFAELELDPSLYKAVARVGPPPLKAKDKAEKRPRRAAAADADAPADNDATGAFE